MGDGRMGRRRRRKAFKVLAPRPVAFRRFGRRRASGFAMELLRVAPSPEFMTTKHLTSKQNMTAAVIKGTYPYGVATRCSNFNVASSPSSRIWTVCDVGARIDMLSRLQPACCAKDLAVLSRECDKLLLELSGRCSRVAVITPADQ